jgi:hypothetical protein
MTSTIFAFERVRSRLATLVAVLLCALVLAGVCVLWYAAAQFAKQRQRFHATITRELTATLGRPVRIGGLELQGWSHVVIRDAAVANGPTFASGTALVTPKIVADVNLWAVALHPKRDPLQAIGRIRVQAPRLAAGRDARGRWDFQDVLDRLGKRPHSSQSWRPAVYVDQGAVSVREARGVTHQVVGVNARVLPDRQGTYTFSAAGRDRGARMGPVRLSGAYATQTGKTQVVLAANHVTIGALTRFLPRNLPLTFGDGTAAVRLSALFTNLPRSSRTHHLSPDELTAEMDLKGVGLRLQELNTPIVVTSGRLRLVHDSTRYPRGSRLELVGVRAQAGELPLAINGTIASLNLFDLAHLRPRFDIAVRMPKVTGERVMQTFPTGEWPKDMQLTGPLSMSARIQGVPGALHIDGDLLSTRLTVSGVHGEDVESVFHLRPGAKAGQSSITGLLRMAHAYSGPAHLRGLTLSLASTTPWARLDEEPVLTGQAQVTELAWPGGEAHQVRGAVTITPERIDIAEMRTTFQGGTLVGSLAIPFHLPDAPLFTARAQVHGIDLHALAPTLGMRGLTGHPSGTVDVQLSRAGQLTVTADITGVDIALRAYRSTAFSGRFLATVDRTGVVIAIPQAVAQTEYGQFAVADGRYVHARSTKESGHLTLPITGTAIPLERFGYPPLKAVAILHGTVTGTPTHLTLTAHAVTGQGSLRGHAFERAVGDLTFSPGVLRLRNMEVARRDLTLTIPGGDAGLDPRQSLHGLQATLTLRGAPLRDVLALFEVQSPWQIDGPTEGTIALNYGPDGLRATGVTRIATPRVHLPQGDGTVALDLDQAALDFALQGRQMQVNDLRLQRGQTQLHAQGTLTYPQNAPVQVALDFTGNGARLEDLPYELAGLPLPITGDAELRGRVEGSAGAATASQLALSLNLRSTGIQAAGLNVGTGVFDLTYQQQSGQRELTLHTVELSNPAFHATARGRVDLHARRLAGIEVRLAGIDLARLAALADQAATSDAPVTLSLEAFEPLRALTGHGEAMVTAEGSFAHPALALQASASALRLAGTPLPNLRLKAHTESRGGPMRVRLDEALLAGGAGPGEVHITGTLAAAGPELSLTAREVTPQTLAPWLGQLPIDGVGAATATLQGSWRTPVLDGSFTVATPRAYGLALHRLEGDVQATPQTLTLARLQAWLTAEAPAVTLRGQVPMHSSTRPFTLEMDIPTQPITPLLSRLAAPPVAGMLGGHLRVGGTPATPHVQTGEFTFTGSADLPLAAAGVPNRLTAMTAQLSLAGDAQETRLTVAHLAGQLDRVEGGRRPKAFTPGDLAASGTVTIPADALLQPERWTGEVIAQLSRVPVLPSLLPPVSGVLAFSQTAGASEVRGALLVEQATLRMPSTKTVAPTDWGPFAVNPRLSIAVQLGEGVKVAQGVFKAPLRPSAPPLIAQASAARTPTSPTGAIPTAQSVQTGTWGVLDGTLNAPRFFARFEVDKERVRFPLSLFSKVRNARGHLTFTFAEGAHLVMGDSPPAQVAER